MPSSQGKHAGALSLAPAILVATIFFLASTPGAAHFKITDPTTPPQPATVQSWMSQDSVGGPQKNGPCAAVPNTSLGDSQGTPTNAVTVVQPGQTVTVPITVTIGHPGWFRISLAEGPSSGQTLTNLPNPQAQAGTNCTPAIMSNPVWSPTQPVLADGLPAGSTASTVQTGTQTFQVKIPSNASCTTAQPCSLQVVMIMTDHPATDCYYHHCADVSVSSGSGTGGATGGNSGNGSGGAPGTGGQSAHGGATGQGGIIGSGGAVATGGKTGSGGATATGGTTGSGGVTSSTGSGGTSATGGTTESGGTTGSGGSPSSTGAGASSQPGSSGCSCTVASDEHGVGTFGVVGLFVLLIARRRRR